MKKIQTLAAALTAGMLFFVVSANAQEGELLFADDFDADSSADWNFISGAADGITSEDWEVNFAWDYSEFGIPTAPNSDGGSTLGVSFRVNKFFGSQYGLALFPEGQHFQGDYVLKFDVWVNFNGDPWGKGIGPEDFPGGGGSTEHVSFGVGSDGQVAPIWLPLSDPSGPGGWFAFNADGGSGLDYRAFANGTSLIDQDGGPYLARLYEEFDDTRDARRWSQPYYHQVVPGGGTVPEEQQIMQADLEWSDPDSLYFGETQAGAGGFMWHQVAVEARGDTVRWFLNDLLIAELTPENAGEFPTEGNIFIGYVDSYTSLADYDSLLSFGLFDNVRVYALPDAAGFASWAEANIADAGARGPGDNPSGDGIANLLKYALGMNPAEMSRSELPLGVIETDAIDGEDYLTLTITRDPSATGVELIVEVSGDLENWVGAGATTILEDTEGTLKVRDNTPISSAGRRFIRVEAVEAS